MIEISPSVQSQGYGMEDWCPTVGRDFSLRHSVHAGSATHLTFYPVVTEGSFPGHKASGEWFYHCPPSSSEVKKIWSCAPAPHYVFIARCVIVQRDKFISTTNCWKFKHDIVKWSSLYSSLNIVKVIKSRRMRWEGHVARMKEGKGVYRVLVGRFECKRPLGRPRRGW
jgi:hypothetical protein